MHSTSVLPYGMTWISSSQVMAVSLGSTASFTNARGIPIRCLDADGAKALFAIKRKKNGTPWSQYTGPLLTRATFRDGAHLDTARSARLRRSRSVLHDESRKWCRVTSDLDGFQSLKVDTAILCVNCHPGEALPYQREVHQEPRDAPVSVRVWVNGHELRDGGHGCKADH